MGISGPDGCPPPWLCGYPRSKGLLVEGRKAPSMTRPCNNSLAVDEG